MSEYTQRYQGNSHQQLYDAVMAGEPEQIEALAAKWATLKGILDSLSRELSGDLAKLGNSWTGSAGREFQRRLTLIVDHTDALSEGMSGVQQGLTMMAGQLRTAHKKAESPDETDDNDRAISGALKGAVFGLPGAVVGGVMGHQQDKAEQEKAHQRMVNVVAELAAGYDLSAYDRVVDPPHPHAETPKTTNQDQTTPRGVPATDTPSAAPTATKSTAHTGGATVAPTHSSASPVPGGGTVTGEVGGTTTGGTPGVVTGPGGSEGTTSLAGADPLLGGALLAGGTAGLVGLSGPTTAPASAGSGPGLLFGAPGGAPAGGVLRTSALAGSSSTPTVSARPAGGAAATEARSASGVGRGIDGRRGEATGRSAAAGSGRPGSGRAAGANRPGILGGHGQPTDDESDERLTWLTEDEMVWRDSGDAAPPVLGTAG
ncbi:WXG100 family type VII secretion target [Micromonospora sp. NPDC047527]|uniref:WXG100 family type VII secretion target n=1 Tax=unclassified Micromonospora TaxID=2617518 RepID=UPI0033C5D5A8